MALTAEQEARLGQLLDLPDDQFAALLTPPAPAADTTDADDAAAGELSDEELQALLDSLPDDDATDDAGEGDGDGDQADDRVPAGAGSELSAEAQAAIEPVYEEIEGWSETTHAARSWRDLPANAVKYVRRLEELIGAPVALLSTSPQRDDTILVKDPFVG